MARIAEMHSWTLWRSLWEKGPERSLPQYPSMEQSCDLVFAKE